MLNKIFGNAWRVTKAVELAKRELGLNPQPNKLFGGFSKNNAEWNQLIDEYIEQVNPNDRELAIFLCSPLFDHIETSHKCGMRAMVRSWRTENEIRADIADQMIQDLGGD